MNTVDTDKLLEVAQRIREMREISGFSPAEMAQKTEVSTEEYISFENGEKDFPFTFIHKCSLVFGIGISDILEGRSAHLSSYTITRKGQGQQTAKEVGIEIQNLAPMFRKKIAEPYYVKYEYSPELQDKPIHTVTHSGQEFDIVLSGRLKVQIGDHIDYLNEGDSIYYNSSSPHGMIAVDGRDCIFVAVVLPGEDEKEEIIRNTLLSKDAPKRELVCSKFIETQEGESGELKSIKFKNEDTFNFAFDIVDEIGRRHPNNRAMLWLDENENEKEFTFRDMKKLSAQAANYFKALGIKKGDKVMLMLRRRYQFWISILGLHKLGAVAIPATDQLRAHDIEYRFKAADVKAIIVADHGENAAHVEEADCSVPVDIKILVGEKRDGWHCFDEEFSMYSSHFYRDENTACGDDPMLMFFTSGTTGYPKIAVHSHKYPLGHYITAKYWHGVSSDGLHFTISDTGWGKALWGKLYGQWLCEGAVFTYDFDRFKAERILPMFKKYNITTFCAPPTILRMMIRQDLSQYDLSSIRHMTTAGEALNPEVYKIFKKETGLRIMEGFGQTELTLAVANLMGNAHKLGSMGKTSPLYDIHVLDANGNETPIGEPGEIVIKTDEQIPCGLFLGYYKDEAATKEVWHDGYYHTGDLAWRDEDGFLWYVGRIDDVIKTSGYRVGPFEIESVIMELPYVLECGVSAVPDEIRGQVVKASIVLVEGTTPSDALEEEIKEYVKKHTAPYKYPRIIVFKDSLPKTTNGKIQRNLL